MQEWILCTISILVIMDKQAIAFYIYINKESSTVLYSTKFLRRIILAFFCGLAMNLEK